MKQNITTTGQICEVIKEVFLLDSNENIDPDMDFISLGIDSLSFLSLTVVIERKFSVRLKYEDIIETRTLRTLTALIQQRIEHDFDIEGKNHDIKIAR